MFNPNANRYAHNATGRPVASPDPSAPRRELLEEMAAKIVRNRAARAQALATATGAEAEKLRDADARSVAFATGVAEELAKLDGTAPPSNGEQPPAPDAASAVAAYGAARYGHNAKKDGGK